MDPIRDPSALSWAHPAIASLGLVLAYVELSRGLLQRKQRITGKVAPEGNLKKHVTLGPWAVALLVGAGLVGPASSVYLRGWKPLASAHGKLGVLCAASFALMYWLGRRLLKGDKRWAGLHGVLGAVTFFAGLIAALLGISMLP